MASAPMPPLFFIHGMWSTPATFARLQARLGSVGHTTVAPPLPLHSRDASLPPPPELGHVTVEDYAQFLVNEIVRLPAPPVIIGHSMGGTLAQIVATRVEHAGLVLLSTGPTASTPALGFGPVRAMAGVVAKWGWWKQPTLISADAALWSIYNGVPAEIAAAEIAALVWDSGRVLAEMIVPSLSKAGATKVNHARLTKPALVIVGSDDRITPAGLSRATARKLGGTVDYHEIAGTGHWLFWGETEERVGKYLEDWLATLQA